MIPETHTDTNTEVRSTVAQEQEQSGVPPSAQSVPPTPMTEARREAPPPAAPPKPPRDRFAASIHRMPRGWRWTLGLGLAFLSGVVAALAIAVVLPQAISVPIVIAAGVLALAAGFVFSTWWAPLLLVGATAIGAWVTILMFDSGDSEVFGWFVILGLLPLFVGLLVGVGIGRWRRVGTI